MRLLAAALFLAYAYFFQGGGWNQNTRFALVRAIVEEHSLRIDATATRDGRPVTGDLARRDGHLYSDKAPGASLAAVPAVAIASYAASDPPTPGDLTGLAYVATLAASAVPTVLAALLLLASAEALGASSVGALVAAVAFAIASPAWGWATLLFGSALATACLLAAFRAALALRDPCDEDRDRRLGLLTGLAGGWATVTEYPAAVPAAMLAALALAHVWRDGPARRARVALAIAAGAAVCAAALALYNTAAFGSPFSLGYSHIQSFAGMRQGVFGVTRPRAEALWGILFGSYRGLFRLAPALLVGPLGLALLARTKVAKAPAVAAAAIAAYYVLLNGSYAYWDGGWSFGPRHMAPALPFLALGLAPLWDRATEAQRKALGAAVAWGAAIALIAVATTAQPPETERAPVSNLLWPAFSRGELSLNHQAIFEAAPAARRDPVTHAWNLGERLGLSGLASLAPLLLAWAALAHRARTAPAAPSRDEAPQPRTPAPRPASRAAAPPPEADALPLADALRAWLTPTRARRVASGLLLAWVALAVTSLVGDAPTVDEFVYPPEGLYYLRTGDFRFNPQNPPLIKLLGAIPAVLRRAPLDLSPQWHTNAGGWEPWLLGTRFMLDNRGAYHGIFVEGRLLVVALGALLGWLVFRWARELWGDLGGVTALAAYVVCPTVLAHARLVTPDLPVTLFMFAASYALWRLTEAPTRRHALALGACVGLAFASKFSAVLLAPILAAQLWAGLRAHGNRFGDKGFVRAGAAAGIALAAAVVVIDLAFGLRGLFTRLGDLRFASGLFRGVAGALPWLRLPLPDALLLGIDAKTADAAQGEFSAGFLSGRWSTTGFRSFYLVSFLAKTPLGLLGLAGVAMSLWRKEDRARDLPAAVAVLAPVAAFLGLSTLLFYRVNYGVRYLLPMFPFLYVACGRAAVVAVRGAWVAPTAAALLLWAGASTVSTHPHYLPYVNELWGGPELAYQTFVDSNVDWGQDLKRLADWARANDVPSVRLAYFGHVDPGVYGLRYEPLRAGDRPGGVVAVSASQLQGLAYPSTYEEPGRVRAVGRDDFAWLRDRTPTAVIGHSIFVYDLRAR